MEYASKASHQFIIADEMVRDFISRCSLPSEPDEESGLLGEIVELPGANPIKHIIAIDGSYTDVVIRPEYPSSALVFFQFGALIFSVADLERLSGSRFIFPEDMERLKNIERLKFAMPTRGVVLDTSSGLTESVRVALYEFMRSNPGDEPFVETLAWLIFEEFSGHGPVSWTLASCPSCGQPRVELSRESLDADYCFACPSCGDRLLLTDVLRLHEAIDDDIGAGGVLGYLMTAIEQLLLAHLIRVVLKTKPSLLSELLFVKDGPLAFFGQTANLHMPMRRLVRHLFDVHDLFLVGAEKSGAFVEHAEMLGERLGEGELLILSNDYIYRHIIPGRADKAKPYGSSTYYGTKLIYRSAMGRRHVLTIPTIDVLTEPERGDLRNLEVILHNVEKLRCDMYDSALIPVALANKLVSLSLHPSTRILEKFAKHELMA